MFCFNQKMILYQKWCNYCRNFEAVLTKLNKIKCTVALRLRHCSTDTSTHLDTIALPTYLRLDAVALRLRALKHCWLTIHVKFKKAESNDVCTDTSKITLHTIYWKYGCAKKTNMILDIRMPKMIPHVP